MLAALLYQGAKLSHLTDPKMLWIIVGLSTLGIVFLKYYFEFLYIAHGYDEASFLDYLMARWDQGYTINESDLGWFGWVIVVIIQLGMISMTCGYLLNSLIAGYLLNRLPREVVEFVNYHLVQGKNPREIRSALASKGLTDRQAQDEVLVAMGIMYKDNEGKTV